MIGNINEIIGISSSVKKDNEEGTKTSGKTSIMTTSTGKTLKRKHEDDVVKIDTDDDVTQQKKTKNEDNLLAETKPEITITSVKVSEEEPIGKKDSDASTISIA